LNPSLMESSWLPGIPFAGRLRSELRAGLRSFPIRSYVLFYRIDGENINLLRVLHGQRDIERYSAPK